MKRIHYIQAGWIILLVVLLLSMAVTPAGAASRTARQAAQRLDNATSVSATVYITTGTLVSIFQSRIDQQVPVAVNSAINNLVSKLPKQDQGWARQIASTLIQPSATLTSLTTQSGGLAISLRLSLYPGDPQPINASMLVTLSVINASTVQVSVKPLNGSPTLVNGALTTFHISLGQLTSINTTPGCGDAALAVHLLFPVSLAHAQVSQVQQTGMTTFASRNGSTTRQALNLASPNVPSSTPIANTNTYVELPASSLAAIGNSIGTLPINNTLSAQNIQLGVQGSNIVINSDIYDSFWGKIATATTTVAPTASGGNLAVHVLSTTLTVLIFTFDYNSYNQQIQQTLNAKLNGALAGKFNVTQAAIGPNAQLPCAAGNSLVLTGTTSLG